MTLTLPCSCSVSYYRYCCAVTVSRELVRLHHNFGVAYTQQLTTRVTLVSWYCLRTVDPQLYPKPILFNFSITCKFDSHLQNYDYLCLCAMIGLCASDTAFYWITTNHLGISACISVLACALNKNKTNIILTQQQTHIDVVHTYTHNTVHFVHIHRVHTYAYARNRV